VKHIFKTQILEDSYNAAQRLAMDIIKYCDELLKYRENLYIALSGGNTAQLLFSVIADEYSDALDWNKIHFFWVDERCVPFESEDSNGGNAYRILFSKIKISETHLHFIHGEVEPQKEIVRYTGDILTNVACSISFPAFDIIVLGMGSDGHTASIFPGQTEELFKTSSICAVSEHPVSAQKRITLTGKVLNNATNVIFLITGAEKAEKLKEIFRDTPVSYNYPAKNVNPKSGNLSWYLDKAAAQYL
jgi:6-phosphogluconolactonase